MSFEKFISLLEYQENLYVLESLYLLHFKTMFLLYLITNPFLSCTHQGALTMLLMPLLSKDSLVRDFQLSKKQSFWLLCFFLFFALMLADTNSLHAKFSVATKE